MDDEVDEEVKWLDNKSAGKKGFGALCVGLTGNTNFHCVFMWESCVTTCSPDHHSRQAQPQMLYLHECLYILQDSHARAIPIECDLSTTSKMYIRTHSSFFFSSFFFFHLVFLFLFHFPILFLVINLRCFPLLTQLYCP